MKVKLLVSRSGVGFSQSVNEEITVSAEEGKRMLDAGQCVLVRSSSKNIEKSMGSKAIEKATK